MMSKSNPKNSSINKLPRAKSPRCCSLSLQERAENSHGTQHSEVCNRFSIHPWPKRPRFSANDYKLFLPYDVYERHMTVGNLIKKNETVIDVGGELDHLSQFCNPAKIVVANLTGGDVIITRDNLPFAKKSFDVVSSIDVLEHLPKKDRPRFVSKLIDIAVKRVILSFPIGTSKHIEYEKETQKQLQKKSANVNYLKEHIKYGLPTMDEISQLIKRKHSRIFYSGNITFNKYLFYFYMFDPQIKYLRKLIYFGKLIFNFLTNPLFYLLLSNKKFSNSVNRAYLIIEKDKK